MFDIEKQIAYWRDGAAEDWEVAQDLVKRRQIRHGLFFAHLALEKLLKALVCRRTQDLAPRIHSLVRLTEMAGLPVEPERVKLLAEVNAFNLEGRYPDMTAPQPSPAETRAYLRRMGEVYQWLMSQLSA